MVEENKVVVVACSANVFLCNIYIKKVECGSSFKWARFHFVPVSPFHHRPHLPLLFMASKPLERTKSFRMACERISMQSL